MWHKFPFDTPREGHYLCTIQVSEREFQKTVCYFDGEGWSETWGGTEVNVDSWTELPDWPNWLKTEGRCHAAYLCLLNR